MCAIHYTIHSCNHWVPQPQPGNKPLLRLCEESEERRLGMPCGKEEHKVVHISQGMCEKCLWKKISK